MKHQKKFVLLPIAMFVASAVHAETTLGVITVVDSQDAKTNVMKLADINKSTATDLRGLLKQEPSINFGGGNGTSQWLTIRGMGQDQVDFKVDNAYSDTQMFHHQGRFLMLDPSLIKRVNVKKGTGSASAGIGATGGAIEITTLDAKDLLKENRDFGFKAIAGYNSNKGHSKGGSVFGKVGSVDVLLSGIWTDNRMYKAGNGYAVSTSALGERGLLGKIGIDINENHRLTVSQRQERTHGMRPLREEFDFAQSGDEARNDPKYRITTTDTTSLQWTGKNMGFISRTDFNAYISNATRDQEDWYTRITTKGANLNLDSTIGENHMIKYGVNWREQEAKSGELHAGARNQKKVDSAGYVEGIWGFGPVTLTTGLRYDHFKFTDMLGKSHSKGNLNPSVGLIWEATNALSFNSSLNYATRSPRLHEAALSSGEGRGKDLNGNPLPSYYTISSNAKAERSRNIEVGFDYKLDDHFAFDGSYFWQNIDDLQTHNGCAEYRQSRGRNGVERTCVNNLIGNGGSLKNQGYELGASYKIAGLALRAGVAYSKPKLNGSTYDSVITAIPIGRTWTASAAYQFEQPRLELGWRGRFVEGASYDTSTNNRGGGVTTTKRPGYGVNDFFVNWQPLGTEDLNVNFALNNAFNKFYRSHSQRAGTSSLPEVGRNFRVNVNYTF